MQHLVVFFAPFFLWLISVWLLVHGDGAASAESRRYYYSSAWRMAVTAALLAATVSLLMGVKDDRGTHRPACRCFCSTERMR